MDSAQNQCKFLFIILVMILIPFSGSAQTTDTPTLVESDEEPTVNLDLLYRYLDSEINTNDFLFETVKLPKSKLNENFSIQKLNLPAYQHMILVDKSPLHKGEYRTGGLIHQFNRNSILYGSGGQDNLIGMGEVNFGTLNYGHRLTDRLVVGGYLKAVTFRGPFQSTNAFSGGASLNYQIADKLSFTAFGNYTFGNVPYALGNLYGSSGYGGFFTVDMGDHFSLGMGAQHYYNNTTGKWDVAPMIIPTIKINEKVSIGMDVGGLVQELIRNALNKNVEENMGNGKFSGTIMPPRQRIPIR